MRGKRCVIFAALAMLHAGSFGLAVAGNAETEPVIIKFRTAPDVLHKSPAADAARRDERDRFARDLLRLTGKSKKAKHDYRRVFNGEALDVPPDAITDIRALDYVAAVYPDARVRTVLADSVPLIGASQVWSQYGVTGAGVRVAIIDTGISYTHPDLGGCLGAGCKVVGGFDFVNNDPDPIDDHGHGTHVAGIVAANGTVKGVAPNATLLAYKALDANGNGYSSAIIAAIDAAANPDGSPATNDGARVINLSLGGWGDPDDPMSQAVDNVTAAGVTVVAAAGNSGPNEQSILSPGTARRAITVGASDKLDRAAAFSSRGPVIWPGGAILKPDLVAPGVAICSTRWSSSWTGSECLDTRHVALSGTSMATPHVAGVAALLLQKNPGWTPVNVKMALRSTALNLQLPRVTQGYGRVRALNASQLSHAPPTAIILTSGSPTEPVDILGSATSATFASYTLSIGRGLDPVAWTTLATSTQPVVNGVLAAGFDPRSRPDDIYTLRLRVTDRSGLVSADRTLIQVDNVKLTAPLNTDSIRAGDTIEIRGTVPAGPQFQSYLIQYGEGYSPASWSTIGVTLTNGGTQPVTDGILGTWDTSAIAGSGIFTLRLVVTNSWGETTELVEALYLDSLLKAGWPVRLPVKFVSGSTSGRHRTKASLYTPPIRDSDNREQSTTTFLPSSAESAASFDYYIGVGLLAPVVADLNNDGSGEVIVAQAGAPANLHVYSAGGQLLWTKPLGSGEDISPSLPAVADLDNDGSLETVTASQNGTATRLFAFRSDGTVVPGFPVTLPRDYYSTIAIGDLDVDGFPEIVVQGNDTRDRAMSIVSHLGQVTAQWPLPNTNISTSATPSTPALGNFDEDAELEIVMAAPSEYAGYDSASGTYNNTGVIHVYNRNGSELIGWPKYTQGVNYSSPVVADISGDGQEDIIVAHTLLRNFLRPDPRRHKRLRSGRS